MATTLGPYKGYTGSIEIEPEDDEFYGTVIGIRDVVHYCGRTAAELTQAFRGSVDDYLAYCSERKRTPDRPETPS